MLTVYWYIFRPKTYGVTAVLQQGNKVLLVRNTYVPNWHLPGGGIKKGETPKMALKRELLEELGAELKNVKYLEEFTWNGEYKRDHVTIFLSTNFTLGDICTKEIAEAKFFDLAELPGNIGNLTKKTLKKLK